MTIPAPDAVLRTTGLTKRYGKLAALDKLTLALTPGSFVALLGPNGAGKSTLFQVLTGLFAADDGDVEVAGHSLRRSGAAALRHIGVVFQQISLDLDLSIRRNLLFQADLHGLPGVLLMDEATVGLDPKSRQDLLAALHADVRERGVCVLWATHWVEEAEGADRVLVLHKGQLLADGSPGEVTTALGEATLEAGFIARTR